MFDINGTKPSTGTALTTKLYDDFCKKNIPRLSKIRIKQPKNTIQDIVCSFDIIIVDYMDVLVE